MEQYAHISYYNYLYSEIKPREQETKRIDQHDTVQIINIDTNSSWNYAICVSIIVMSAKEEEYFHDSFLEIYSALLVDWG